MFMSFCAKFAGIAGRFIWLALAASVWPGSAIAKEETFDVLQIGTHTYTNVTVTTKAKTYVFIMHSTGMANLKLSEIPPEVLQQLGYGAAAEKPKSKTEVASQWAKDKLGSANIDKVNAAELKAREAWIQRSGDVARAVVALDRKLCGAIVAVLILFYVFCCRCCAEICKKAGKPAGVLAWLPGFQLIPLLKAAGMSPWWFLGYLVPPVAFVLHIVWSFKIAKARGKTGVTGFFLMLPLTSLFAFIYLAFSD